MLLRPAYRRLDAGGVVGAGDAATFPALGVDPARITVTGDARFDQVQRRVDALDRDRPLLRLLRDTAVRWLVAGSTWPADEGLLVDALTSPAAASFAASPWRIVFAPHEPTPAHIEALERRLTGAGIAHARLPTGDSPPGSLVALPPTGAIIVDRVGVLADLYAIASVAYVGGGFGSAGLHSVVEPAALGVPVVHGPRLGNAQEAARLDAAGGGFTVRGVADAAAVLQRFAGDDAARAAAGIAARAFVQSGLGGAAGSAAVILDHVRTR